MYHPDFTMGRLGYFDILVWNPLQSALINEAADHSGVAAEAGVYEQRTVYTKSQFVTVAACSFHWWSNALGAGLIRVWNI